MFTSHFRWLLAAPTITRRMFVNPDLSPLPDPDYFPEKRPVLVVTFALVSLQVPVLKFSVHRHGGGRPLLRAGLHSPDALLGDVHPECSGRLCFEGTALPSGRPLVFDVCF